MIEELNLKEKVARGDRAERILKDPLFRESIDEMRKTLCDNIETSGWRARGEREEAYRLLKLLGHFEDKFKTMLRDGKIARSRLEEIKRKIMR